MIDMEESNTGLDSQLVQQCVQYEMLCEQFEDMVFSAYSRLNE